MKKLLSMLLVISMVLSSMMLAVGCSDDDTTGGTPACDHSYTDGVCDKCGTALYTRDDDAPQTVINRLKTYHEQTEPLKEFYAKKGLLVTVEGQEKVEDTTALTLAALSRFEA